MMNLTLRQLQAFVLVVQTRQFTLAAHKMHITQSALSTLVKELESSVGLKLLDRHTRRVEPTEAGLGFYVMAEKTLADLENAVSHAHDLASLRAGRVSVAASTVLSAGLLSKVLKDFKSRYPDIRIVLRDVAEEHIVETVRVGHVDLAVGTSAEPDQEIEETPLLVDRFIALCCEDHPLSRQRHIAWRDLEGFPFIALAPTSPIRQLIDATTRDAGVALDIAYEVSFATTVLSLVGVDLGVSVLPMNNHPSLPAFRIHAREVIAPVVTRQISIFTRRHRGLSPAAAQFVAFLRDYVASHPDTAPSSIREQAARKTRHK